MRMVNDIKYKSYGIQIKIKVPYLSKFKVTIIVYTESMIFRDKMT
jgi:hypothetical protein